MNESDLVSDWLPQEIEQFMDVELVMDAELYKSELETEWTQIEPVLEANAHLFPNYSKE